MTNTTIQFRMEEELRTQFISLLDKLGLDLPTAVRMFAKKAVAEQGIPFSLKIEQNTQTKAFDALKRSGERAALNGTADMSAEEIDAEISLARNSRRMTAAQESQ